MYFSCPLLAFPSILSHCNDPILGCPWRPRPPLLIRVRLPRPQLAFSQHSAEHIQEEFVCAGIGSQHTDVLRVIATTQSTLAVGCRSGSGIEPCPLESMSCKQL